MCATGHLKSGAPSSLIILAMQLVLLGDRQSMYLMCTNPAAADCGDGRSAVLKEILNLSA